MKRIDLSAVVAAELRAGPRTAAAREALERRVLAPYFRHGRVLTPSAAGWDAPGTTLATLAEREGLDVRQAPRSFVFDVLVAHSCREAGAVLVSANRRDLERIARVFAFEFAAPYPVPENPVCGRFPCYYVGYYTRPGGLMPKIDTYPVTPARIGNSRGYRIDASLFRDHPEMHEGSFEAAYLGAGTLLVRPWAAAPRRTRQAEPDTDPVVSAYLAWTERAMTAQPELLRPMTLRDIEVAEALVEGVEVDLEHDRLPDDFELP